MGQFCWQAWMPLLLFLPPPVFTHISSQRPPPTLTRPRDGPAQLFPRQTGVQEGVLPAGGPAGGCWCWSPCCGRCCPPSLLTPLLTRLDLSWLSSLKCWWQLLALLMLTPTLPQLLRQTNQSQRSAPTCRHLRANQSRAVQEQYRANGPHYSVEWNYVHFAGQAS